MNRHVSQAVQRQAAPVAARRQAAAAGAAELEEQRSRLTCAGADDVRAQPPPVTAVAGVDLLALIYMRWSRNMPRPATEWPALERLASLVRARPSWSRLCDIEQLTDWRA